MSKTSSSLRRDGMAIISLLVAMAVLAVLFSVMTVQVVSQHRLTHRRERQLQAHWLARAGVEYAHGRLLRTSDGFTEENVDLMPDTLLRVHVEKSAPNSYTVSVEATVGAADEAPVRRANVVSIRRTESGGKVHLQSVLPAPPGKSEKKE